MSPVKSVGPLSSDLRRVLCFWALLIVCSLAQTAAWSQDNNIGINNENTNVNTLANTNTNAYQNTNLSLTNPAGGAGGQTSVIGGPSAYANVHMFNSPWNFTPPTLLFHPTKTINDNSIFCQCRLIPVSTSIRDSWKDRFLGVFDEREFIASGVGRMKSKVIFTRGKNASPSIHHVIACGLGTALPPSVSFIGTGYIYMEDYSSTEAALVALSQMASSRGANLIGNINCPYAENLQNFSTALGAASGGAETNGDSLFTGTLGASWGTTRVKRPVQPHCTGDFYVASLPALAVKGDASFFPQPRPYRRYLPPAQPTQSYNPPAYPQQQEPVRGYW